MIIDKIHKLFSSNKLFLFIFVIVFILMRLYSPDTQWNNSSLWGCLVIQILIAFYLLHINQTYNIIQSHTFLPALFYLLFIGSNPIYFYDMKGSIAALCFVLCFNSLFDSYQKPESQVNALNISLLLVLGSLLWSPLLFFIPVIWIGFHNFQCFNIRVFFASLMGFVIVYLIIFTLSLLLDNEDIFFSLLPHFESLIIFQRPDFTILEWSTWGFLLVSVIIIGIYLYMFNISERVWTVSTLNYFYLSAFISFVFLLIQSEYKSSWGLIVYIPTAFLCGYAFSRSNKRFMQLLLLLFFTILFGIVIAQHSGV